MGSSSTWVVDRDPYWVKVVGAFGGRQGDGGSRLRVGLRPGTDLPSSRRVVGTRPETPRTLGVDLSREYGVISSSRSSLHYPEAPVGATCQRKTRRLPVFRSSGRVFLSHIGSSHFNLSCSRTQKARLPSQGRETSGTGPRPTNPGSRRTHRPTGSPLTRPRHGPHEAPPALDRFGTSTLTPPW